MPRGFEQFVEEYYQSAYRFALSLCCNPADASDLTQQVFYIAQGKFHQVRDESKQKSWLFTILSREFTRERRKRGLHPHHSLELVEAELPPTTVDHATQIDAHSLLSTMLGLDEHFRVPLSLFYFEQLSYKEIALTIGIPIGTVMSRLARGKELLRQSLAQTRRERLPGHTGGVETAGPMAGKASKQLRG